MFHSFKSISWCLRLQALMQFSPENTKSSHLICVNTSKSRGAPSLQIQIYIFKLNKKISIIGGGGTEKSSVMGVKTPPLP